MKLFTFEDLRTGEPRPGSLIDEHWAVDLGIASRQAGMEEIHSIDELVREGDAGIARAKKVLNFAEARLAQTELLAINKLTLLTPCHPVQMRCFSAYPQHARNASRQVLKHEYGLAVRLLAKLFMGAAAKRFAAKPFYYKGIHMHIAGPGAPIIRPPYGEKLDFELELGVIIGKKGKNIAEEDALSHVFGYTIFNDVSARKQLRQEVSGFGSAGPAKGKDFDNSNIIGPWIVTRDEIEDPQALRGVSRVNGKEIGHGSTGGMAHSIARQIAHASYGETIYPGEMIGTGAMENCCGIEHWTFLEDGDEVELEIEKVGVLRNRVTSPNKSAPKAA